MTNQEIKEKYGIEPVMKEGWCWDDDKTIAKKCLCLYKDLDGDYIFYCYLEYSDIESYYKNFSETDPNIIEPKVGDWGWFSNTGSKRLIYDKLIIIHSDRFEANEGGLFDNFSITKPDFLK